MSLAAAVAAGEEAYDDATEADNGADDGLKNAADAANDGHDGVADSAERGLDLEWRVSNPKVEEVLGRSSLHKRRLHP